MAKNPTGPIKLDRKVPIPPHGGGHGGRYLKYPWDTMQVGDSFFVAGASARSSIPTSARSYGRGRGIKFNCTLRTVTERGVKGVRIWRVE